MHLRDLQKLNNGACFHNVDLHIHSYGASSDVTDPTMTPEAIVDSAIRQGLRVIAITDHNNDANCQKAISYALDKHANDILVLPGVEVTTAHGHLLVYFATDKLNDLAKFLVRIDLVGEKGHQNTRTAKSMADTIQEAERLGGICIAAHIDREGTGFDKFAPGFQNWKRDILLSSGLFGLECDAVDNLVWYSDSDEAGPVGGERKNILQARRGVVKGRPHLAHVQGSDSHRLADFENGNITKKWTRMKLSELSFRAFVIALTDPHARVRAVASIPRSFPKLHGVAISGGFLDSEAIHFSNNLTCFIGGRGTGKSTAIRAVAYAFGLNDDFGDVGNCPDSITVWCEDTNGILYRYARSRGEAIEVKAKEDCTISDVPFDSFRIEYFGQGELARIAEDPLKNPKLFQDFLDRHTNLSDLVEKEGGLLASLRENGTRLVPLETVP